MQKFWKCRLRLERGADELFALKQIAAERIAQTSKQRTLFSGNSSTSKLVYLNKCEYLGFRYGLMQEVINNIFVRFKFHLLRNKLLTDLVAARIVEPSSKLQSLKFLADFFGVTHKHRELYRQLPKFSALKTQVEVKTPAIAKKEFNFTFALVFYDVTTLYFKTGKSTKATVRILKSATDARILNTINREEITMRSVITEETKQFLNRLGLRY